MVFVGDAVSHTRLRGFHAARSFFSEDVETARTELDSLWVRLQPHEPDRVCTAHAMCTEFQVLLEEWSWTNGEGF